MTFIMSTRRLYKVTCFYMRLCESKVYTFEYYFLKAQHMLSLSNFSRMLSSCKDVLKHGKKMQGRLKHSTRIEKRKFIQKNGIWQICYDRITSVFKTSNISHCKYMYMYGFVCFSFYFSSGAWFLTIFNRNKNILSSLFYLNWWNVSCIVHSTLVCFNPLSDHFFIWFLIKVSIVASAEHSDNVIPWNFSFCFAWRSYDFEAVTYSIKIELQKKTVASHW